MLDQLWFNGQSMMICIKWQSWPAQHTKKSFDAAYSTVKCKYDDLGLVISCQQQEKTRLRMLCNSVASGTILVINAEITDDFWWVEMTQIQFSNLIRSLLVSFFRRKGIPWRISLCLASELESTRQDDTVHDTVEDYNASSYLPASRDVVERGRAQNVRPKCETAVVLL